MSPFCCWGLPAALLALLFCPGSGEEAFEVYMSPAQLLVKHGGSSEVNCSTSCLQPTVSGLETTLSKTLLHKQPQWELYRVFNVSTDTVVYCHFTCSGRQVQRNASVTVFCGCLSLGPPPPAQRLPLGAPLLPGSWGDKEQDRGPGLRVCSHPSLASVGLWQPRL